MLEWLAASGRASRAGRGRGWRGHRDAAARRRTTRAGWPARSTRPTWSTRCGPRCRDDTIATTDVGSHKLLVGQGWRTPPTAQRADDQRAVLDGLRRPGGDRGQARATRIDRSSRWSATAASRWPRPRCGSPQPRPAGSCSWCSSTAASTGSSSSRWRAGTRAPRRGSRTPTWCCSPRRWSATACASTSHAELEAALAGVEQPDPAARRRGQGRPGPVRVAVLRTATPNADAAAIVRSFADFVVATQTAPPLPGDGRAPDDPRRRRLVRRHGGRRRHARRLGLLRSGAAPSPRVPRHGELVAGRAATRSAHGGTDQRHRLAHRGARRHLPRRASTTRARRRGRRTRCRRSTAAAAATSCCAPSPLATSVGCRIAAAVQPGHYRYWHTTGTVGTLGAAAAAGRAAGARRGAAARTRWRPRRPWPRVSSRPSAPTR